MQELSLAKWSIGSIVKKYATYGIWPFFAYFIFQYTLVVKNGGDSWTTGDWLINYSAGPIRRGLTGEFIFILSSDFISLLWFTYAIQIAIYSAIFLIVLALYKTQDRPPFWLLILFSPAFLLFPFYDTQGGFRKEIIIFAVFSLFCLFYSKNKITVLKIFIIIIAYAISAFSHELNSLTWPFFVYILYLSSKKGLITPRAAIISSLTLIAISATVLLFASLHKGDATSADKICSSLTSKNLHESICDGAISWLKEDAKKATDIVKNSISKKSLWTPALFFLAIAPLFFTTWIRKESILLIIIGTATISPLFFVAIDYGRWIYILVFLIFCLALSEDVRVKFSHNKTFFVLGFMYLTTWSIPHCCMGRDVGAGLIGYLLRL